jgi:hypothetical protein
LTDNHRDRSAERIGAAERALADAHARLRSVGADPDAINTAFAIARDCLSEAWELTREARREFAMAHNGREQANAGHQEDAAGRVVPDAPGQDLCPDPSTVQTPAQYMATLKRFRVWAGEPSYREMEEQCGGRFAASTIHAALKGDELPRLAMIQSIITACRGTDAHQQMFASAWRRLYMPQHDAVQPRRSRDQDSAGGTA